MGVVFHNNSQKPTMLRIIRKKNFDNNNHVNTVVPAYENRRQFVVEPNNAGKAYYILQILEKK